MGLLDSVIGALGQPPQGTPGSGAVHPELMRVVAGLLSGGGLAGLVQQFQRGGLGELVGSWIGTGQNLPISPGQLQQVLGSETIAGLAQQTGLAPDTLLGQLAHLLPQAVDHVTPDGHVPASGVGDLGQLLGRFLQR